MDYKRLMESEIRDIARTAVDSVYEGTPLQGAGFSVFSKSMEIDPDYVEIVLDVPGSLGKLDAGRLVRATLAITDAASKLGDERNFVLRYRWSREAA